MPKSDLVSWLEGKEELLSWEEPAKKDEGFFQEKLTGRSLDEKYQSEKERSVPGEIV